MAPHELIQHKRKLYYQALAEAEQHARCKNNIVVAKRPRNRASRANSIARSNSHVYSRVGMVSLVSGSIAHAEKFALSVIEMS